MDIRKFLVLALIGASTHMHAISPGMVVAFLQAAENYAPQVLNFGCVVENDTYSFYLGLRGIKYQPVTVNNGRERFECNYRWSPFKCQNLIARAGITAALAVCTSSFVDLLFKRRSLREIGTVSYLTHAAASGLCGGLVVVSIKNMNMRSTA